jgi:hypothetical protein
MAASKITDFEVPANLKGMPPLQAFGAVWPLLRFVLAFVKIFTGSKADAKIDQILEWGDGVAAVGGVAGALGDEA